ncbi:MAG: hypothetical protein GY801_46645 [bacterium]|nr:hypothetical protein [bacterium]
MQPTIRYHLGIAYAEKGSKELAIKELNGALAISSSFREAEEAKQKLEELQTQ